MVRQRPSLYRNFPWFRRSHGTLVKRDLRIGGMLNRDDPAPITVINLERVWVVANIFEHDLAGSAGPATWRRLRSTLIRTVPLPATSPISATKLIVVRARFTQESKFPIPTTSETRHVRPSCNRDGQRTRGGGRSGIRHLRGRRPTGGFVPSANGGYSMRPVKLGSRGLTPSRFSPGLSRAIRWSPKADWRSRV